ncbi:uncharacterized protein L201_003564 [Kwoniella dendrophila CBS 6074]|uniref:WKF domain-containing protein n=1 Tax=Kwoniella dendrophila CBS 6074 TaxID=1295534 RepID=A0AAX4JT79_9TREE
MSKDKEIKQDEKSSSKDLEKLEKKLKKAEEKMKKAEEKMRIVKEEYEKAQIQAQVKEQVEIQIEAIRDDNEVDKEDKKKKKDKKEKKEKKDKKRKRGNEVEHEVVEQDKVKVKELSGLKVEEEPATSSNDINGDDDDTEKSSKKLKKDKKEKKLKTKSEIDLLSGKQGDDKVKTIFNDTELSDQAKKNIYYAHLFSISRTSEGPEQSSEITTNWKFAKAKQNWLIRNIFSIDEIPDKYVELVFDYLKTVQGLSKTNLIESAKKIITPPPSKESETQPTEQPIEAQKSQAEITVQQDTDKAEEEIIPSEVPEAEEEKDKVQKDDKENENKKKERAQKLLDVMDN